MLYITILCVHPVLVRTRARPTTDHYTTARPTTARPTTARPTTARPTTSWPITAWSTTAWPTTARPTTTLEEVHLVYGRTSPTDRLRTFPPPYVRTLPYGYGRPSRTEQPPRYGTDRKIPKNLTTESPLTFVRQPLTPSPPLPTAPPASPQTSLYLYQSTPRGVGRRTKPPISLPPEVILRVTKPPISPPPKVVVRVSQPHISPTASRGEVRLAQPPNSTSYNTHQRAASGSRPRAIDKLLSYQTSFYTTPPAHPTAYKVSPSDSTKAQPYPPSTKTISPHFSQSLPSIPNSSVINPARLYKSSHHSASETSPPPPSLSSQPPASRVSPSASPPTNLLLPASPLSHEQAPPLSHEQARPLSDEHAPPISHEQAPPLSHEQAPPLSHEQAPPLSPPLPHQSTEIPLAPSLPPACFSLQLLP